MIYYDAWNEHARNDEADAKASKEYAKGSGRTAKTVFEGHAPDDAVVVKFTGDHKMQDIEIKEEAVDPDDVDMLQDLVIAAVNDAIKKVEQETQRTMGKYSRNIPGL